MTTKRICIAAMAAAIALGAPAWAPAWAKDADPVAATVNGHAIHLSEVQGARGLLPPQFQNQPLEAVYGVLLDSLINSRIASQKARKLGLDETPEFKQRLARISDQILERMLLTRHIESLVDEAALQKRYAELVARAATQHEAHARHILVKAEDVANAVIGKLDDGADFAELAKEYSVGPSAPAGGDLGWFGPGRMVASFEAAAMALEAGAHTATPVRTQFGWHVIKVEETRPVEVPPFEELRPALVNDLSAELGQKLMDDLRADATVEKVDWQDLK